MSLYDIALFVHVVSAFGLIAALAIESVSVTVLSKIPRRLGGPATGLAVLTGVYMAIVSWRGQAWTGVALAALILMGVLGGTTGRRSLPIRWALVIGIAFLMTTKPGPAGSVAAVVVALVGGLAAAIPAWRATRNAQT